MKKGNLAEVISLTLSLLLSFILLESSGVNIAKANIFNFEDFSWAVLILLSICIHFFSELLTKAIDFISMFFSKEVKSIK